MPRLILVLLGSTLSLSAYATYAYTHQGGAGAGFSIGTNKLIDRSDGDTKTLDSIISGTTRINVASIESPTAGSSSNNSASSTSSTNTSNADPTRTDNAARIFEAASKGFVNNDFLLAQADRTAELPASIWDTTLLPDDPENVADEPISAGLMVGTDSSAINLLATSSPAQNRQVNGSGSFGGFNGFGGLGGLGGLGGFGGFTNLSDFAAEPTPVPEPNTYALLLSGIGAVGFMAKRRTAT